MASPVFSPDLPISRAGAEAFKITGTVISTTFSSFPDASPNALVDECFRRTRNTVLDLYTDPSA